MCVKIRKIKSESSSFKQVHNMAVGPKRGGKRDRMRDREKKRRERKEKKIQNNVWPIASNKVFLPVPFYHPPHSTTVDYVQIKKKKKFW